MTQIELSKYYEDRLKNGERLNEREIHEYESAKYYMSKVLTI